MAPAEPGFGSLLVFPTKAASYCVKFVVKDLRTQEEVQTEVCEEAEPTVGATSDSGILACLTPPNKAVAEGWCAVHVDSTLPECLAVAGDGTSGDPGNPTKPSDVPDDGPSHHADEATRTSEGCQMGGSPPLSGGALPLLALLLLRRLRRR